MKKIIKALVPRCLKEKIRKKGWLLTEDKIIFGGGKLLSIFLIQLLTTLMLTKRDCGDCYPT